MSSTSLINYGRPEPVYIVESELGEGPFWHHRLKLLFWLDCFSNRINIFDPAAGSNRYLILPEVVGSIVPVSEELESGSDCKLLAGLESGFYEIIIPGLYDRITDQSGNPKDQRITSFQLTFLSNPEAHIEGNRFNDGKCDPAGRYWTGTMSRALDSGAGDLTPKGSLYCLELKRDSESEKYNPSISLKLGKVIISNGIAFSPDKKTMYYNDTPTRKITAFYFNVEKGEISNPKAAYFVPKGWGNPDGMTIDSEGMLWVALWDGFRVIRVNPISGEAVGEIRLPVRNVTSCTFGGDDLDELYITTSRCGLEGDGKTDNRLAGSLFRIKLPVKGILVDEVKIV